MSFDQVATSEKNKEFTFNPKRIFVNNVDSYHGSYFIQDILKFIAKAEVRFDEPLSKIASGEDVGQEGEPALTEFNYEVYGTSTNGGTSIETGIHKIVPKSQCVKAMLTCGLVLFDISIDPEEIGYVMDYVKVIQKLFASFEKFPELQTERRFFVLVSTVMTWANTKPLDPEEPEMPFVETDFRKRRPHPGYTRHYDAECEIVLLARNHKANIGATVVCAGVTYGGRELVLGYWFQRAWEGAGVLPLLGRASNAVPLISADDLSAIAVNILITKPKKLYVLAVEQNITKQKEIIKPLGKAVGSGMFKYIPTEDALIINEISEMVYDRVCLNLFLEPGFVNAGLNHEWIFNAPFEESIPLLIKQFKKERQLKPFKVIIHGPPIVGKTCVAKAICEKYGLIYVSPETVFQDIIDDLVMKVEHLTKGEKSALPELAEGELDEDEDDSPEQLENMKSTLALMQSGFTPTDDEILGYIRQRLTLHDAENRGWVVDGFPMTRAQAEALFASVDDEEVAGEQDEENFAEDENLYEGVSKKLLPDIVVDLIATDEFICGKAMRLPEDDMGRFEEETMLKRLEEYGLAGAPDSNPLRFFRERDIHPLEIIVDDHNDYQMQNAIKEVCLRLGQPCKYGTLAAAIEEAENAEKAGIKTLETLERRIKEENEQRMEHERQDKMEYWTELFSLLKEEEEAAYEAAGEPLRNYLVTHIFPTLTPLLLKISQIRPDDPIDFLAENLFARNPTGKMLEPGFNFQSELLFNKLKLLDDELSDLDIVVDPIITPECDLDKSKKNTRAKFNFQSS